MRLVQHTATCFRYCLFLSALLFAAAPGYAQPSGGPYGPIDQRYEIPKAAHVYYVAPDGKPDSPGTSLDQPTTLAAAIERVVTGDAVILRGGVYRTGGLLLNQGITLQPYLGRTADPQGHRGRRRSGRRCATTSGGLPGRSCSPPRPWAGGSATAKACGRRCTGSTTTWCSWMARCCGRRAGRARLDAHSYYIDYEGGMCTSASIPPTGWWRSPPSTARSSAPALTVHGKTSDRKGPVIRGITFTQYAYRALEVEGKKHFTSADEPTDEPVGPSDPATFGKEVTGTVLENVTITYCSRVAGYFRGDGLIIRNSLVSDTSTEGHLCHRVLRRAAGAEHHPAEQHRAAHRLLPGRGQDLQPVAPRHVSATTWCWTTRTRPASGTTWATATACS